jgi:hypothetical protein
MNIKLESSEFNTLIFKTNGMIQLDSDYLPIKSTTKTTTTTTTTYTKETKILRKLFKILKYMSVKMEQNTLRDTDQEIEIIEWKELAIKIEKIFLVLSLITVVFTPIILFGKFFYRDFITQEHLSLPCGCENSFIKNF